MKRAAGILLPVFSLPGDFGIGSFSIEAYHWIDCLKEAGQSYWQILPLGPTGYGDSPYQSFSSFAGNPDFIDLEGSQRRVRTHKSGRDSRRHIVTVGIGGNLTDCKESCAQQSSRGRLSVRSRNNGAAAMSSKIGEQIRGKFQRDFAADHSSRSAAQPARCPTGACPSSNCHTRTQSQ